MDRVLTSLIAFSNFMRYSHKRPAVFGGIAVLSLLLVPALTLFPKSDESRSLTSASAANDEATDTLHTEDTSNMSSKPAASTSSTGAKSDSTKPSGSSKSDENKTTSKSSSISSRTTYDNDTVPPGTTDGPNAACPDCDAKKDGVSKDKPAGVLVVSKNEFTLQQGETLREAFTARAENGNSIGLVTSSWTATPEPVSPVLTPTAGDTTYDISKSYETWNMGLQSFGAAGDFDLKIQASDGATVYYATITVHVLPN